MQPTGTKAGDVFGRLTLVAPSPGNEDGKPRWLCRCACGTEKSVGQAKLRNGNTTSCGCRHRERASEANTKHGMYQTWLYKLWENIKIRCYNPKAAHYHNYGGRGIKVCPRWKDSFENFRDDILAEIGERPTPQHSLDRIKNDEDYKSGNVRWSTTTTQGRNKRTNKLITAGGKTRCLAEWVEVSGLSRDTINNRIRNLGWPEDRAVTQPLRGKE